MKICIGIFFRTKILLKLSLFSYHIVAFFNCHVLFYQTICKLFLIYKVLVEVNPKKINHFHSYHTVSLLSTKFSDAAGCGIIRPYSTGILVFLQCTCCLRLKLQIVQVLLIYFSFFAFPFWFNVVKRNLFICASETEYLCT